MIIYSLLFVKEKFRYMNKLIDNLIYLLNKKIKQNFIFITFII